MNVTSSITITTGVQCNELSWQYLYFTFVFLQNIEMSILIKSNAKTIIFLQYRWSYFYGVRERLLPSAAHLEMLKCDIINDVHKLLAMVLNTKRFTILTFQQFFSLPSITILMYITWENFDEKMTKNYKKYEK